ncbi:MAG: NADH-quinone oxidoreductase subunit L [Acidobacteria bacterium]|nr:NADH-quinone oxidoreductase subunit L [Acidobacteriota bacterium]
MDSFWLIPILPLVGFLANGLVGKRLPKQAVAWIACLVVAASLLLSARAFYALMQVPPEERHVIHPLFTWVESGDFVARFEFLLDPLSAVMMLLVTGVGLLIHVYSVGYMWAGEGFYRYFAYLNLFMSSMLLLVAANNLLLMFVGWEGVGLCSYLLIGYWYFKKSASDAGKKAFVVNRVGDFGFLLGILLAFLTFQTLDFQAIFQQLGPEGEFAAESGKWGTLSWIAFLLFIGATGKSAQVPLYVWLPDAMEGPTPVSALIHAATMVTAGVYMVVRLNPLYSLTPGVSGLVATVGIFTAFYAATIALVQRDIKRILAYSTISQIGYMFAAAGVGGYAASIFHLSTHAYFKALLFLGAGSVMRALQNETDILRMGGLRKYLPVTYWTFLAATVAISGVPLTSGFFSKDEILVRSFSSGHTVIGIVGLATAVLTAFYMFRLFFLTFHGEQRLAPELRRGIHEPPPSMAVPLVLLALLSLFGGYGYGYLEGFLEPVTGEPLPARGEHSEALVLLTAVASGLGILAAYLFYVRNPTWAAAAQQALGGAHRLLWRKYYVDELYDRLFVHPLKRVSDHFLWRGVDERVVDGAVNGTAGLVRDLSGFLRQMQTGYARAYATWILLGTVGILVYYWMGG